MYQRALRIHLPLHQSAFLWGARQTGKSTYLKNAFPDAYRIDLLRSELFERYSKRPSLLREVVQGLSPKQRAQPIIIDEVQKIPLLLDEVHYLIESEGLSFILCGSSARKLKRGGANLLGGRAWVFESFPLTHHEIPDFDLLKALNQGLLPPMYAASEESAKRSLRAYVNTYLKEEIQAEGLVRNLVGFSKFLDTAAFCNGEMINYANIATDVGIDQKTVKEYFQILYDTLIGYEILPYVGHCKREIINKRPKFYFFDVGIWNQLAQQEVRELRGMTAGKAVEHWVLMELMAYRGYHEKSFAIHYWRTKTGLEVDFVLGKAQIALEVKISSQVRLSDLQGLRAFLDEYPEASGYVISLEPEVRVLADRVTVLPWTTFSERLWAGEWI